MADEIRATPRNSLAELLTNAINGNNEGAYFGNPNLARQGARAREQYQQRDVNTLPDPTTNVIFNGLMGTRPDQMGYSVLHPDYQNLREVADPAFAVGTALGVFPLLRALGLGKGVQKVGQVVGEELGATLMGQRPNSMMSKIVPQPLFAVPPEQGLFQAKPQAPVSNIGFYSAAEQAAMNLNRNKGTGQSFINDLMKVPDVKKEEMAYTGLDDFLANKPNVTKQEVQDFIAQNKVNVNEVMLGGNEAPSQDLLNWMSARSIMPPRNPEGWQELSQKLELYAQQHQKAQGLPEASQRYFTLSEEAGRISEGLDATGSARSATQHSKWQLPGGENYREILLTLPEKAPAMYPNFETYFKAKYAEYANPNNFENPAYKMAQRDAKRNWDATGGQIAIDDFSGNKVGLSTGNYTSSHFNEPNILAHMRVNDRIDAEGKKMLLIEEVQSDWHQAGRKGGYLQNYKKDDIKPYTLEKAKEKYGSDNADLFWYFDVPDNTLQIPKSRFATQEEALNYAATKTTNAGGVPDAPFKDTWHQVALKRALKYAAENGYERVGLTTGKQQIERYSDQLRQNVSQIEFQTGTKLSPSEASELQALRNKPHSEMRGNDRARMNYLSDNEGMFVKPNETRINAFNGSRPAFSGTVANGKFLDGPAQGKTVEEVLGSSIAKQIAEKPSGTISGENLSVGGEGMKKYYDEIYPNFLDKYGKKYGAKVGETRIKTGRGVAAGGEPVRYIDITPEMKQGVTKGQPLHGIAAIPALPIATMDYTDPFPDTTR